MINTKPRFIDWVCLADALKVKGVCNFRSNVRSDFINLIKKKRNLPQWMYSHECYQKDIIYRWETASNKIDIKRDKTHYLYQASASIAAGSDYKLKILLVVFLIVLSL